MTRRVWKAVSAPRLAGGVYAHASHRSQSGRSGRAAGRLVAWLPGRVNGYTIEPGADLRGQADLARANLSGANLSGANLIDATLYKANLNGADLAGATLDWARASADTVWPEGFSPRSAGVKNSRGYLPSVW